MYGVGMRASGCEKYPICMTTPRALRRPQPAVNAPLTHVHQRPGNRCRRWRHGEGMGISMCMRHGGEKPSEPRLQGGDGQGMPSLPLSWSAMTIAPSVYCLRGVSQLCCILLGRNWVIPFSRADFFRILYTACYEKRSSMTDPLSEGFLLIESAVPCSAFFEVKILMFAVEADE
ncbi:hypothetical protein IW261DRAFT_1597664 [Armillaria novae-zelandiae]|uniref:Uncharacterized protein n=1 Tax=Armillaria novae-zelandiae TaxID=153914 RepID=A0AA39NS81_9AGAR|nr:hypothetical protein IW261DRAFT_1597664 [Armillaria novae-zelandiae]